MSRFARLVLAVVLFVLSVLAIATLVSGPANAGPIGLLDAVPAQSVVGFVDSYAVSCTGTATALSPASLSPLSITCSAPEAAEANAAVFVGIGDGGLADPALATRTSPIICGTGCAQKNMTVGKGAFCRADTGTVVIYCVATTGSSS